MLKMNTPSPVSPLSLATFDADLPSFQKEIMKWVGMWYITGKDFNEARSIDFDDLVCFLQALDFKLTQTDVADSIKPLEKGGHGIRVTITCQDCRTKGIFEKPGQEEPENVMVDEPSTAEVSPSATKTSSKTDLAKYLSPLISDDLKQVLRATLSGLLYLSNDKYKIKSFLLPSATEDTFENRRNRFNANIPHLLGYIVEKPVQALRKTCGLAPRCRSLDSVSAIGLPEPRRLSRRRLHHAGSPSTAQNLCPTKSILVNAKAKLVITRELEASKLIEEGKATLILAGSIVDNVLKDLRKEEDNVEKPPQKPQSASWEPSGPEVLTSGSCPDTDNESPPEASRQSKSITSSPIPAPTKETFAQKRKQEEKSHGMRTRKLLSQVKLSRPKPETSKKC